MNAENRSREAIIVFGLKKDFLQQKSFADRPTQKKFPRGHVTEVLFILA